jgi:hypothetical protein
MFIKKELCGKPRFWLWISPRTTWQKFFRLQSAHPGIARFG